MAAVLKFTVFADYFQFILMDEESDDDFSLVWTDEALHRMLAVGRSSICPGTLRNMDVEVEVHIVDQPPDIDVSEYDHIAEASFQLDSGNLVVMSCTGYLPDAPRIKVASGCYRVLSLASGIKTIKTEWEPADDLYKVFLWKSTPCEPQLIKHWDKKNV